MDYRRPTLTPLIVTRLELLERKPPSMRAMAKAYANIETYAKVIPEPGDTDPLYSPELWDTHKKWFTILLCQHRYYYKLDADYISHVSAQHGISIFRHDNSTRFATWRVPTYQYISAKNSLITEIDKDLTYLIKDGRVHFTLWKRDSILKIREHDPFFLDGVVDLDKITQYA